MTLLSAADGSVTLAATWLVTFAQEAGAAEAAPRPSTTTLLQYIRHGGPVGFLLITLSMVGVALVIVHYVQVRRSRLAPEAVAQQLGQLLRAGDIKGAMALCADPLRECFLTRVMGSAMTRASRSPFGFLEVRSAIEEAGSREVDRLSRVTDGVGLIAAVGPMLGLLGTVFGMIGAFGSISELEGAARSRELAGFMSLALVNTAQGLAVAIPATVFFSLFKRRTERIVNEVGEVTEQYATMLEAMSQGGGAAGAAVAAKPVGGPRPAARPVAPAGPVPVQVPGPGEPGRGGGA